MKNSFGSNLSVLRKRAGVSQESLAEQLNVSRQAVSNWERNLSEPDISTINKISELLNVPVSDLMDSPTGGGQSEPVRIKPALTVLSAALAAVHFVLGLCGLVNIFAAVSLPVTCAFIQSTIYMAFTMMFRSNNYDMLAGFDPRKDSVKMTRLQMYWVALLSGLTAVLFELLFVLIYFIEPEKQMDYAAIMVLAYCAAECMCVIAVNGKIKSRK